MVKADKVEEKEVEVVGGPQFASLEFVLGKESGELVGLAQDVIEVEKLGTLPISAISNPEYKVIKKECMSFKKAEKGGRMVPELDEDKLMLAIVIEAVHKDERSNFTFRSKELLAKLGVITAEQAAEAMLSPGEIFKAAIKVQDLSGFGDKAEEEAREEIKNS